MKNLPAFAAGICSLLLLLIFPEAAKSSVSDGLNICGRIIIPSLFPYLVAVNLIAELGIIAKLTSHGKGSFSKAAFIIGISGGYPVGASFIAEARKRGEISRDAASRLLIYCNNSGPAFIIGAVGTGVFNSAAAGITLYAAHIASAIIYGKLLHADDCSNGQILPKPKAFSAALVDAVKKSVSAMINVCGFVLTFSVFLSIINSRGLLHILSGRLSSLTHTELSFNSALIAGIFELGNSISQMQGLAAAPLNLALAAFVLGWGGISVHFQTFSVISDTDIKTARYIIGRFFIAALGALIANLTAHLFRI